MRLAKPSDRYIKLTPGSLHEFKVVYGNADPSLILGELIKRAGLCFVCDEAIFGVWNHVFFMSWRVEHPPLSFYKKFRKVIKQILERNGYLISTILMENGAEKGAKFERLMGAEVGKPYYAAGHMWTDAKIVLEV